MKKMLDFNNIRDYLAIILILILLFTIWYIYWNLNDSHNIRSFFNKESDYHFISPLLSCPQSKSIQDSRPLNLKLELEEFMNLDNINSWVNHVSVYFRDMYNWYRFWINEKELFTPASLTKVPTMIALLKKSESEPNLLSEQVKYKLPNFDYNVHYPAKYSIESDKVYTIQQLLEYMIKYSDNNSTQVLRDLMGDTRFHDLYADLWINYDQINNIQVTDYASFFRILFNASYLNKKNSELALNLLSQVDFTSWLVAWIPSNIKVSHKFWEYSIDWNLKQIHDCGIIYYPDHPYLLCVMTRWNDYDRLEKTLHQISKIIFEHINNIYDNKDKR